MFRSLLCLVAATGLGCGTPDNLLWQQLECAVDEVKSVTDECIPAGTCAARGDCDVGERCVNSTCVPDELPDPCEQDEDCVEGEFCGASGACLAEGTCSDPEDCRVPGEVCTRRLLCMPEGRCEEDGDCEEGRLCEDTICNPGGGCGETRFDLDVPPNLMILLDRSSSMNDDLDGRTKWEVAVESIAATIGSWEGRIRFGLSLFPDCAVGERCAPGSVVTPCADGTTSTINDTLAVTQRCLSTPLGESLSALAVNVGQANLSEVGRRNAVLLISDGADTCEGDHLGNPDILPDAGATELVSLPITVPTYVVGFGSGSDAAELTAVAEAAGTDRGDPAYYQADTAGDLTAALDGIAGRVLGCVHPLSATPPDPNRIYAFFNGDEELPRNGDDGWIYDEDTNTVTFVGEACARIEAGDVEDIDVFFGCPDGID